VDMCTNKIQEVKGITVLIIAVSLVLHACQSHISFSAKLYLCVYNHLSIRDIDEVYAVGAYSVELERRDTHDFILGNSTPKYSAGEDSNMAYYADGHLSNGLINALLAMAFFRCW
jgi:hypothetical protein